MLSVEEQNLSNIMLGNRDRFLFITQAQDTCTQYIKKLTVTT